MIQTGIIWLIMIYRPNNWSLRNWTYLLAANEVWGKVMFLYLSVILFTGGSAPLHAGIHPPGPEAGTPQGQTPPQEQTHPRSRSPWRSACWEIRATTLQLQLECNLVIEKIVQKPNGDGKWDRDCGGVVMHSHAHKTKFAHNELLCPNYAWTTLQIFCSWFWAEILPFFLQISPKFCFWKVKGFICALLKSFHVHHTQTCATHACDHVLPLWIGIKLTMYHDIANAHGKR